MAKKKKSKQSKKSKAVRSRRKKQKSARVIHKKHKTSGRAARKRSEASSDRNKNQFILEEKVAQVEKAAKVTEDLDSPNGFPDELTLDKTPMRIYLQQIESIPLLNPDEEAALAKQAVSEDPIGSAHARHKMIRSNLRLVISIAKRYTNLGLHFSDLVEEGNIGLMKAVDRFNYKKGYRFSTYASWWIKQAIMRALSNQGKTIRVPVYMYDTVSKFRKVRENLIQKLGRIPNRKELADAMELPATRIKEIEQIASQPSSLNAPVSLEGSAEMMDLIEDATIASPIDNLESVFKGQKIDELLNHVDERERQILVLRFGLRDGEVHTLEETAKIFGVTRERIRQIELSAIRKIRNLLRSREERFEDYVR